MNISVQGSRTSVTEWEEVRGLPERDLPPLSVEQRAVARKLGIPELDYARSFLAGERTLEKMVAKTERFARYLSERLRKIAPSVNAESVLLNTWDGRFEIHLNFGGRSVPVSIAEGLVDDFFDSGSAEMERRLDHVLGLAVQTQVA
jgi:hypothetical protein